MLMKARDEQAGRAPGLSCQQNCHLPSLLAGSLEISPQLDSGNREREQPPIEGRKQRQQSGKRHLFQDQRLGAPATGSGHFVQHLAQGSFLPGPESSYPRHQPQAEATTGHQQRRQHAESDVLGRIRTSSTTAKSHHRKATIDLTLQVDNPAKVQTMTNRAIPTPAQWTAIPIIGQQLIKAQALLRKT